VEEILDKIQKFPETNSSLQDMQKNLQNKLQTLYQRRDTLVG